MEGTPFSLATFAGGPAGPFAAIVLGETAFSVAGVYPDYRDSARGRAGPLTATGSIQDMLEGWDHNFPVLQEIVLFIEEQGHGRFAAVSAAVDGLRVLPPVLRPGKILNAAQNFQEHVDEMIRAGNTPEGGPRWTGDRSTTMPYLFLKAPGALAGAHDDIAIPRGMEKIDWEAEIACAIWKRGRRIGADDALDHVAGWMTANDVSCRDLNMRSDRPALKSDWFGGKSHNDFAPMGPALVPKAFVADHMNLSLRLAVNGEIKQDGNTSQFIYTPEEQIEFASGIAEVEVGDIFVCGTCGGVGMGTGTFLQVGDLMETEVEGLGKMTNRLVADTD